MIMKYPFYVSKWSKIKRYDLWNDNTYDVDIEFIDILEEGESPKFTTDDEINIQEGGENESTDGGAKNAPKRKEDEESRHRVNCWNDRIKRLPKNQWQIKIPKRT